MAAWGLSRVFFLHKSIASGVLGELQHLLAVGLAHVECIRGRGIVLFISYVLKGGIDRVVVIESTFLPMKSSLLVIKCIIK